jgi:hypothetical protein
MCKYMMDGLYYMCDHLDAARRPSLGRGSPAPKTPRRKRRACNETLRTMRRMRMMSGLAGVSRLVPARFPASPVPRSPAPPLPRSLALHILQPEWCSASASSSSSSPTSERRYWSSHHTPPHLSLTAPRRAGPYRVVSCRVDELCCMLHAVESWC